ncbi:hypothetical protein BHM03_00062513 [Ensete ventricosum]|nr:hypothetical protein BHM03_00062513 [Ensete ventricosum]
MFSQRTQQGGGSTSHGQPPCKAGHPRLGRGHGHPARGGRLRARQVTASPQGGATARGQPYRQQGRHRRSKRGKSG